MVKENPTPQKPTLEDAEKSDQAYREDLRKDCIVQLTIEKVSVDEEADWPEILEKVKGHISEHAQKNQEALKEYGIDIKTYLPITLDKIMGLADTLFKAIAQKEADNVDMGTIVINNKGSFINDLRDELRSYFGKTKKAPFDISQLVLPKNKKILNRVNEKASELLGFNISVLTKLENLIC
ncbi:hypothetical protein ACFL6I_11370 [candidate division KSB1 bacterium]